MLFPFNFYPTNFPPYPNHHILAVYHILATLGTCVMRPKTPVFYLASRTCNRSTFFLRGKSFYSDRSARSRNMISDTAFSCVQRPHAGIWFCIFTTTLGWNEWDSRVRKARFLFDEFLSENLIRFTSSFLAWNVVRTIRFPHFLSHCIAYIFSLVTGMEAWFGTRHGVNWYDKSVRWGCQMEGAKKWCTSVIVYI